jgi:hypothetical protein
VAFLSTAVESNPAPPLRIANDTCVLQGCVYQFAFVGVIVEIGNIGFVSHRVLVNNRATEEVLSQAHWSKVGASLSFSAVRSVTSCPLSPIVRLLAALLRVLFFSRCLAVCPCLLPAVPWFPRRLPPYILIYFFCGW